MPAKFKFEAIGTSWSIDIGPGADGPEIYEDIKTRIEEFDKAYSRFRKDSLVSLIASKAGEYRLPDDAEPMMRLYRDLYEITGGLVTPLVGQVLVDAGYDANYSLKPKGVIDPAPNWDDVMEYSHPVLRTRRPVLLDFGALGKGYLIDIVSEIIESHGVEAYTVDAGGDIRHRGDGSIKVGLEDPRDKAKAVGEIDLRNLSICGSAGNRRVWDRFHHIIDPRSVESPRHILGLWTVAHTTLLADAMSTALFFVGPDNLSRLLSRYRFEYAVIGADGGLSVSKGWSGRFFAA